MPKHHNYAVKAHYNYSVTEGVLKRKSISPLDVSVWCMLVSLIEPEAHGHIVAMNKLNLHRTNILFFKTVLDKSFTTRLYK